MTDAGTTEDSRADEVDEPPAGDGDEAPTDAADEAPAEDVDEAPVDEAASTAEEEELAALRERVEDEYDFDDFRPADMASMSADEWDAAFDPDTWITGPDLLDRLDRDLRARIASREVFARIERHRDPERLVAYSDQGYAMVHPDGTIEGRGTVLRDVKPIVALCSMESYDVTEPEETDPLPRPTEVPDEPPELGNRVLQVVAGVQVLAGVALLLGAVGTVAGPFGGAGANPLVLIVAALGFLVVGVLLFVVVANARLSAAFRAEEYRDRLRAVGLEDGERPPFVPDPGEPDGALTDDAEAGTATGAHGVESADGADDPIDEGESADGPTDDGSADDSADDGAAADGADRT